MPENDTRCSNCGKALGEDALAGCITARIMGDTCTDCYYWCGSCEVYTLRLYRDVFVGEETSHDSKPIPREEGDRRLALIRRCADPSDDRCRCDAHLAYFGGWVD